MKQSIGTSTEEREIMHGSYMFINRYRSKALFLCAHQTPCSGSIFIFLSALFYIDIYERMGWKEGETDRQIDRERQRETERDTERDREREKTVKKPRLSADPNTHKCLLPEGSGGQDVAKVLPADNAQVTVAEAEWQQRCVVAQALTQVHGPLIAKPARTATRKPNSKYMSAALECDFCNLQSQSLVCMHCILKTCTFKECVQCLQPAQVRHSQYSSSLLLTLF